MIVNVAPDRAAARAAIVSADVVFVPARISPLDLVGTLGTVEPIQRLGKRFAVVMNFYSGEDVFEAENTLRWEIPELCPLRLTESEAHAQAMKLGRVALEDEAHSVRPRKLRSFMTMQSRSCSPTRATGPVF